MTSVSVIIPARNEKFLSQTVDDVISKAVSDIEVIVMLDGCWADPPLRAHNNLTVVHTGSVNGMRVNINTAARIASGKYIMKLDGHCMVDDGFDEILMSECERDWLVVPSRYSLDCEKWERGRGPVNYLFLTFPYSSDPLYGTGLHGRKWHGEHGLEGNYWHMEKARRHVLIDDIMTFQGSCWFMHRDHFLKVGCLDTDNFYNIYQEAQELGMKTWLSGGRCIRNKKTWYAHLHKGKRYGRGFRLSKRLMVQCEINSVDMWVNNRWPGQVRPFKWLVDKFWPLDGWPDDWENPRYAEEYMHPRQDLL